jgi:hypothetical protein
MHILTYIHIYTYVQDEQGGDVGCGYVWSQWPEDRRVHQRRSEEEIDDRKIPRRGRLTQVCVYMCSYRTRYMYYAMSVCMYVTRIFLRLFFSNIPV